MSVKEFVTRRDDSSNNIPIVGYNDGLDATDVILFGLLQVTDSKTTDANGNITLNNYPASISSDIYIDSNGYKSGRNLESDIIINAGVYFAGSIDPSAKTLKIYSDASRVTTVNNTAVSVQYYKRVPITVDSAGRQTVNINNSATVLPTKSRTKVPVFFKKEASIAASATTVVTAYDVNAAKDTFITNAILYTEDATALRAAFLKDGTANGTIDMRISPITGMTQLNFGESGFKLTAGNALNFITGSGWGTAVMTHIMVFGYQWVEVTAP